jgi:hypothetical protein
VVGASFASEAVTLANQLVHLVVHPLQKGDGRRVTDPGFWRERMSFCCRLICTRMRSISALMWSSLMVRSVNHGS